MHILIDSEKVIRAICNNDGVIEYDESGVIWINGAGYGLFGQQIHEVENVPEYVAPDKYKYLDGRFVENENYSEPLNQEELAQKVKELENIINALIGGENNE